jgi:hypothetical protein
MNILRKDVDVISTATSLAFHMHISNVVVPWHKKFMTEELKETKDG